MQKRLIQSIFRAWLFAGLILPVTLFAEWQNEYEAAVDLVKKGRYAEAIPKLQAALKERDREGSSIEINGQSVGYFPYYYLGKSLFYRQDYSSAVQQFEKCLGQGEIQKKKDLFRNLTDLKSIATAQVNLDARNQPLGAPAKTGESKEPQQINETPKPQEAAGPAASKDETSVAAEKTAPVSAPTEQVQQPTSDQAKAQSRALTKDGARRYFSGEIDGAVKILSQALTFDPENATAQFLLGCCFATKYLLSGSTDQRHLDNASSAFQKAKRFNLEQQVTKSPFISPAVLEIFAKA